jgi:cephalosporin hydroxylase
VGDTFFSGGDTVRILRQSPDLPVPMRAAERAPISAPAQQPATAQRPSGSPRGCCAGGRGLDLVLREAYRIGMLQDAREIRAFCEWLQPRGLRHVLEIGSYRGGSFYLWCNLLASGLRISVDCASNQDRRLSAAEIDTRNRAMGTWPGWVHIIAADSTSPATLARVREILAGRPLDFLFIDGGHAPAVVWSDSMMFGQLVRAGGVIAWHDIANSDVAGPRIIWAGLRREPPNETREFNYGANQGIGALVKGTA